MNDKLYFGCKNKWQVTEWFKTQFEKFGDAGCLGKYMELISLDIFPGEIVHEFTIKRGIIEDIPFEDDMFNQWLNDDESAESIIVRVVLRFEKNKISDIRIPRYYMEKNKVEKFQSEN